MLLGSEELPGVDVDVVPEVLLEAVVIVSAVLSSVSVGTERRRLGELSSPETLLASVKIHRASLVPDLHALKISPERVERRKSSRNFKKSGRAVVAVVVAAVVAEVLVTDVVVVVHKFAAADGIAGNVSREEVRGRVGDQRWVCWDRRRNCWSGWRRGREIFRPRSGDRPWCGCPTVALLRWPSQNLALGVVKTWVGKVSFAGFSGLKRARSWSGRSVVQQQSRVSGTEIFGMLRPGKFRRFRPQDRVLKWWPERWRSSTGLAKTLVDVLVLEDRPDFHLKLLVGIDVVVFVAQVCAVVAIDSVLSL